MRVKSTSSGDSMTELWGNFMNRDKSPSNSRVSSRRASSLYMMGRSTDSGEYTYQTVSLVLMLLQRCRLCKCRYYHEVVIEYWL